MLLGIPGDNTYSHYQEASRAFWRQTVLPLVNRTARAISGWLGSGVLEFRADLDQVEALSPEREALWARLDKATFLTRAEKRAAAGYGDDESAAGAGEKFNPYHDELGLFTDAENAVEPTGGRVRLAQNIPARAVARVRIGGQEFEATPAQAARLEIATGRVREAQRRVRELDPLWQPPASMRGSLEGAIRHYEAVAEAAEARFAEIVRDAIPNTNPSWGVNRLRKELNDQGYVLIKPARDPGLIFQNPTTGAQVRIMERPSKGPHRTETLQKFYNDYYYRYRSRYDQEWGEAITIPNK